MKLRPEIAKMVAEKRRLAIGRIPECAQIYELGEELIQRLIALHEDTWLLNPKEVQRYGWSGIWANNSGELDDDEFELFAQYFTQQNIDALYAVSLIDLKAAQNGRVLLVKFPHPTAHDVYTLQQGMFEITSPAHENMRARGVYWGWWREAIYFNLPMTFVLARMRESWGNTTLVGEPKFIEWFKRESKQAEFPWYDWPDPNQPKKPW